LPHSSQPEPGHAHREGADTVTWHLDTAPVADKAVHHGCNRAGRRSPLTVPSQTWRLQNAGQTTWSTAYSLVFVSGSLMSAQAEIAMPQEVIPGDTVDISVELVAPAEPGIYQSLWKLRNDKGQAFGVGETGSDPIWAIISVVAGAGQGTPTAAPSSGRW
jgi:hypothetical protein